MRRLVLILAAAGCFATQDLLAQGRPWLSARPCTDALPQSAFRLAQVTSVPRPQPPCREQRCATLASGGTVCQCTHDTTRIIRILGVGSRPFELFAGPASGIVDTFAVIEADLNADGLHEVVIPLMTAESNGMGVDYWTVYILTPGSNAWGVDSLVVEDYDHRGSWVVLPGERKCNLLGTHWVNGFEAGRGGGLYYEASWYALEYGRLERRMDRPVLHRRFLYGFQRARRIPRSPTAPLSWLQSSLAKP
jgi:hypothetical protein